MSPEPEILFRCPEFCDEASPTSSLGAGFGNHGQTISVGLA